MVPKCLLVGVLLAIIGMNSVLGSGYLKCPIDSKGRKLVIDVEKNVPASNSYVTLDIRVPETGELSKPLSCISLADLDVNGTGGTVTLVAGGLESKFVQLKIRSKLNKPLKYRIQMWSE